MTSNKKRIRLSEIIGPAFYETHKLIDMGFNQKQAVAVLYVISAILGLSAVVLTTSGPVKAMLLLLALCFAGAISARIFLGANGKKNDGEKPDEKGEEK